MVIGIGIDLVKSERIKEVAQKWGERFLTRIFTPLEQDYSFAHKHPYLHLAGRFAIKEAVFKAIGNDPKITWKDIKISHDNDGRPVCLYPRKKLKRRILISISHTKHYAVASAIITS